MSSHSSPLSPLSANTPSICIEDTSKYLSASQSPLILPTGVPSTSPSSPMLSSCSGSVATSISSPARTTRSLSTTSGQSSLSSSKKPPSSSRKSKPAPRDSDWSEITDPEERRRVQNRLAQRKFREKTRENKEKSERDARNREHAGNCYRTPATAEMLGGSSFSGLPWGGIDLGYVMSKGHEHERRQSSGRETQVGNGSGHSSVNYDFPHNQTLVMGSFGDSNGSDDVYMTDTGFIYNEPPPPYPPLASFSLSS